MDDVIAYCSYFLILPSYFPTVTVPPTVWLVVEYEPLTVTPLVAVLTEPEMVCLGVA